MNVIFPGDVIVWGEDATLARFILSIVDTSYGTYDILLLSKRRMYESTSPMRYATVVARAKK